MGKKLLYLQDLYDYYFSKNENINFSSKEGDSIVVHVDGNLNFESDSTEGLTPVVLQSCHIGKNLNGSNIDEEVMEKALPSFKNRPILGYIHEVDGEHDFYGHNMHLDDDGNVVYDEIAVGIIPESCDAHLEYDEEKDKTYCVVKGYLFDEYTKATEIMKRKKRCSVSVELCIRELSYNAKDKVLDIKDFFFSGVTMLGKDENGEEVKPGMANSNIKLADFSQESNSMILSESINEKLVETIDRLNDTLSKFNIDDSTRKDVNQMEKKDLECFDEENSVETIEGTEEVIEEKNPESAEEISEENIDETAETEGAEENVEEDPEVAGDSENVDPVEEFSVEESLNDDCKTISFELSFDEITYALYNLVCQFNELDNEWYFIHSVYEDHFVMQGLYSGCIYGCKYVKEENDISLEGERWALHQELLTDSELASLNEMRSNYSCMKEKLESYEKAELNALKDAVFKDEAYSEYLEAEEFKSLIEDKDNYSVEELKDKAEIAFAKCIKREGAFSKKQKEVEKVSKHTLYSTSKETVRKPYGNLFDKN